MNEFKNAIEAIKKEYKITDENLIEINIEPEKILTKVDLIKRDNFIMLINKLGKRFEDVSFDNYKIYDDRQMSVLSACRFYASMNKSKGESLYLYGESGTGKNHLITAIVKELNIQCLIESFDFICEEKRACQQSSHNWFNKLNKYFDVEMLIIPDLVIKENGLTDSQKEILYYLIDKRINNYLPIIIATNLPPSELKLYIDYKQTERVQRRFKDIFSEERILKFDWTSYKN